MEIKEKIKLLHDLEYQNELGVNINISNNPIDRYKMLNKKEVTESQKTFLKKEVFKKESLSKEKALNHTLNINTFEDLEKSINSFDGCPFLSNTASNTIFDRGNRKGDILFIANNPSADDDKSGESFSNNRKKLIDQYLDILKIDSNRASYINGVFWYPQGERFPTSFEFENCLPFVIKYIELMKPKIIIAFGREIAKIIAKKKLSFIESNNKIITLEDLNTKLLPTFSFNMIEETKGVKMHLWLDLLKVKKHL